MPVPEVKAVIEAGDAVTRNRLIAAYLDRLESELARTRSAVGELRDLLAPPAPHPIEHRTVPATPAIAIQETIDREDVFAWWQGAIGELTAGAQAQGLRRAGPLGGLFGDDLFHDGRRQATICLPCEGEAKPVGRMQALTIPAAELAIARHDGSPSDVDRTYGELAAHVTKHEIGVAGPLREVYVRGLAETPDSAEWQTEIGWPIFRTHA